MLAQPGLASATLAAAKPAAGSSDLGTTILSFASNPAALSDAAAAIEASLTAPASSRKAIKGACVAAGVLARSTFARERMAGAAPLVLDVLRRHEADAAVVQVALEAITFLAVDSRLLALLAAADCDCAATVVSAVRRHSADARLVLAGMGALISLSDDAAVCARLIESDAVQLAVDALKQHARWQIVTAQALQALCGFSCHHECSTAKLTDTLPLMTAALSTFPEDPAVVGCIYTLLDRLTLDADSCVQVTQQGYASSVLGLLHKGLQRPDAHWTACFVALWALSRLADVPACRTQLLAVEGLQETVVQYSRQSKPGELSIRCEAAAMTAALLSGTPVHTAVPAGDDRTRAPAAAAGPAPLPGASLIRPAAAATPGADTRTTTTSFLPETYDCNSAGVHSPSAAEAALRTAAYFGRTDEVKRVLAADSVGALQASPSVSFALRLASANGHADIVACLLGDARVDAAKSGASALHDAAATGRLAVMDCLLADPRIDPAHSSNCVLLAAAQHGRSAAVARLIADARVDPFADNSFALRKAVVEGRWRLVDQLWEHERIASAQWGSFRFYEGMELHRLIGLERSLLRTLAEPANAAEFLRYLARCASDGVVTHESVASLALDVLHHRTAAHDASCAHAALGAIASTMHMAAAHKGEAAVPMCSTPEAVAAIVAAINRHSSDERVASASISALWNLSYHVSARPQLVRGGSIACLLNLLREHSAVQSVVSSALHALGNIVNPAGSAGPETLLRDGGLSVVLSLLRSHAASAAVACAGLAFLSRMLDATDASVAAALADVDVTVLPIITAALRDHVGDADVVKNAAIGLVSLAEVTSLARAEANRQRMLDEGVLALLLAAMQSHETVVSVIRPSVRTLYCLSDRISASDGKSLLAGAVSLVAPAIFTAIRNHGEADVSVHHFSISTLCKLTFGCSRDDAAQLVEQGAMPLVLSLLRDPPSEAHRYVAALEALTNLCYDAEQIAMVVREDALSLAIAAASRLAKDKKTTPGQTKSILDHTHRLIDRYVSALLHFIGDEDLVCAGLVALLAAAKAKDGSLQPRAVREGLLPLAAAALHRHCESSAKVCSQAAALLQELTITQAHVQPALDAGVLKPLLATMRCHEADGAFVTAGVTALYHLSGGISQADCPLAKSANTIAAVLISASSHYGDGRADLRRCCALTLARLTFGCEKEDAAQLAQPELGALPLLLSSLHAAATPVREAAVTMQALLNICSNTEQGVALVRHDTLPAVLASAARFYTDMELMDRARRTIDRYLEALLHHVADVDVVLAGLGHLFVVAASNDAIARKYAPRAFEAPITIAPAVLQHHAAAAAIVLKTVQLLANVTPEALLRLWESEGRPLLAVLHSLRRHECDTDIALAGLSLLAMLASAVPIAALTAIRISPMLETASALLLAHSARPAVVAAALPLLLRLADAHKQTRRQMQLPEPAVALIISLLRGPTTAPGTVALVLQLMASILFFSGDAVCDVGADLAVAAAEALQRHTSADSVVQSAVELLGNFSVVACDYPQLAAVWAASADAICTVLGLQLASAALVGTCLGVLLKLCANDHACCAFAAHDNALRVVLATLERDATTEDTTLAALALLHAVSSQLTVLAAAVPCWPEPAGRHGAAELAADGASPPFAGQLFSGFVQTAGFAALKRTVDTPVVAHAALRLLWSSTATFGMQPCVVQSDALRDVIAALRKYSASGCRKGVAEAAAGTLRAFDAPMLAAHPNCTEVIVAALFTKRQPACLQVQLLHLIRHLCGAAEGVAALRRAGNAALLLAAAQAHSESETCVEALLSAELRLLEKGESWFGLLEDSASQAKSVLALLPAASSQAPSQRLSSAALYILLHITSRCKSKERFLEAGAVAAVLCVLRLHCNTAAGAGGLPALVTAALQALPEGVWLRVVRDGGIGAFAAVLRHSECSAISAKSALCVLLNVLRRPEPECSGALLDSTVLEGILSTLRRHASVGAVVEPAMVLLQQLAAAPDFADRAHASYYREVIAALLSEPSPSVANRELALGFAAQVGDGAAIDSLLSDIALDPSVRDNAALSAAARGGHVEIVRRLLTERRVDPASLSSAALRWAASLGHADVVACLLADGRSDPGAANNAAIRWAATNGHAAVVECLLASPRVDASVGAEHVHPYSPNPVAAAAFGAERLYHNFPIAIAAANGHLAVVERLLAHRGVYPSVHDSCPLRFAAANGHVAVVDRLLAHHAVNPTADDNYALRHAAANGHTAVVERLLADLRIAGPGTAGDGEAVRRASDAGYGAMFQFMLASHYNGPAADNNFAIRMAAANGHLAVVERLLADPRVDPAADGNFAIRRAAQLGHFAVVERLLAHPKVDPTVGNGEFKIDFFKVDAVLMAAAQKGHAAIVARLLTDPRVNPALEGCRPLREAVANGHADVVDVLLADPRVDPAADSNAAIRRAAELGHGAVVARLLADPRVDPTVGSGTATASRNYALLIAAERGHVAVVDRLLGDPRVDPALERCRPLCLAAQLGHLSVVDRLLADHRVDPSIEQNAIIRWAAQQGYAAAVERLLADPRVDPAANNNEALRKAVELGLVDVVDCLLRLGGPRVDPSALDNAAVSLAVKHGRPPVLERLLADPRVNPLPTPRGDGVELSSPLQDAAERKHRLCMHQLLLCPAVMRHALRSRDSRRSLLSMLTYMPNDWRACMASHAWVRRRAAVLPRLTVRMEPRP